MAANVAKSTAGAVLALSSLSPMTVTDHAPADYRLPTSALPRRYELRLAPDLESAPFEGAERIEIEVQESTSVIVLNALDLEIHEATITPGWRGGGEMGASSPFKVQPEPEREMVTLRAAEPLAARPLQRGVALLGCAERPAVRLLPQHLRR